MAEERYIVTATLDGKTQRKEFDNIDGNRYDAMRSRFGENMRIDRLSEMKEGDPIYSDKPYIVTATLDGKTQSREFMGSELTEDMQRRLASRFGENWSISRPEEVEAQESYMVTGGGRSQLWDKSRFDRSYEDYKALHPEASYQRSIMFRDKQDDASRLLESSRALADARAANDDFILEYEENRKALDTAMRTGAASPYESYISENRERYAVAKGEITRLEKELHSNPLWQERRESMATGLGEMNAAVRRETEEYIAAHPDEERELLESAVSMNAYSPLPNDPVPLTGRKVPGSVALLYKDERDKYIAARRLMDDSVRLFNAPSRYGTENGFMNYLKGMGDTFSDIDFWTRGLTSIADNMQLYDVLSSFQDKFGKVDAGTITEQQLDGMFSPAEKALLNAFATNALVQSERASDLSLGYQAGQGAAESLGYMAEFILTGGVGKAAASPVKTALTRWLARGLTKMTAGAGKTAAKVAGKYGIGLLTDAVKTAAMTGVMPSTYDNIASSLVEVTEEGKLPEANKAIGTAVVDSMIEQGGEIRGSKAFGALTQKITGKLGSMMPDELIRILKNNGVTRFLKEGGYDGFPEEMIEEWWSAALRSVTIDPDALKDFATVDSQLVMAASFIPITLMGGVASGGQRLHLRRRFENSERKLRDVMRNSGYADDQADYMVSVLRNASPQTISDRLTPVIVRMASESTAGQAKDLFGAAADFAEASMRFRTSEALHSEKDAEARDIELDAILRQTGGAEFWMNTPLKNGMNSREVHEAIVHSGETYFILDASVESESGPVEIPAMDEHGNKRFLRDEDISLMLTPMPLESWLSDRIMRRRHEAETERMSRDEASQVQALRGEAWPGTEINIGTEEVPVHAVVVPEQTTADDFVLVQTDDGATRSLSWQEFGYAIGSPVQVYTDAETEAREADLIDEDRSAREKALAEEAARLIPDTGEGNAGEGLIEEAADIASGEEVPADATGTADIPLKEDGTVDETSLWNQNPEQWALWNDGQRNDGGRDSDMYIANAIGTLNADIAGLESDYVKEPDMDARQSIRSEIEAKGRRLSELQNIAVHRNAVREGFPKPIAANGETADGMAGGDADVPAAAIPADENGRPQYHLAPVESSLADIYSQGLTQDEIDGFIDANIAESEKELEKLSDKAPKIGTDIQAYRKAKSDYENAIAAARNRIDYWNQMKLSAEAIKSQSAADMEAGEHIPETAGNTGEQDGITDNPIQGLESYSRNDVKNIVRDYTSAVISESGLDAEVVDVEIHGSRNRGDAKEDSDLDVVVEYHGKSREDDMFNALNDETNPLEIEGVRIDINPIRPEETGDMVSYMSRSREYDEGKMQTGAPAVYSDSSSDTGTLKTNAGVHLSDFAKGVADEVYSKLPDNLKGRVSVRSSSDGNESEQSFIQRYDIDGKPSKVYFISLFGTDITTNPNHFAIEGYNVDNQEQWYEYSRLFDEYVKSYPDVRAFDHDEAGALFDRFEDALDFSKFAEKRMSDADIRLKHAEGALSGENFTGEEKEIISKALADGTYMKAPNGADSKLSVKQWAQVRTKAFKEWFGDWEKAARIEKLRKSAPVEITGEEYIGKYELNRDSAKKWIKDNLRGEYKNRDTGELIKIRKDGAQKVTSHSMGNEAHLKSLAAIPQMIENAIFIDELPNEKGNGKYDSYRYYVCGLKIGGADYTAKITVGVKGASKFYDHALTEIEKGTLIDNIDALSTTFDKNQNTLSSGIKDSKLLSLLQTNSSKVVDENGEPRVVYHGTPLSRRQITPNRGWQADGTTYIRQEAPFSVFRGGEYSGLIFTSDSYDKANDIASKRAMGIPDDEHGNEQWTDEGYVYSLYLNSRNPFDPSDTEKLSSVLKSMGNEIPTLSFYGGKGENVPKEEALKVASGRNNSWLVTETPEFLSKIRELGYDGLIGYDEWEKYTAVVSPDQIKSATDNTGAFSSENDDIRYRRNWYGGNSGYVGYSMSRRAAAAREDGKYPKTDFKKEYKVSDKAFTMLVNLGYIDDSEWHHTSKYGNKTTFYSWTDESYADIYQQNKKEIDGMARDYASAKAFIEDTRGERYINDRLMEEGAFAGADRFYPYLSKEEWEEYNREKREMSESGADVEELRKISIGYSDLNEERKLKAFDRIMQTPEYAEYMRGENDRSKRREQVMTATKERLLQLFRPEMAFGDTRFRRTGINENNDIRLRRGNDAKEDNSLIAVHNISEAKLSEVFKLGGFPMPSIAVTKADVGHTEFGEISLVFGKESIDPSDRRNRVYGEDAWTPVFPSVSYKLDEDKTSDIYRRANKVGTLPFFNPVHFHPDNYENYINGISAESIVNHFKDDYGTKQFYLAETGNPVTQYEQHEVEKYSADRTRLYDEVLKKIGLDRLKNDSYEALENELKQIISEHDGIDFGRISPGRVRIRLESTRKNAIDYAENGNTKTESDIDATQKKIDERIDSKEFEQWLDNLFAGVVEKKGIRNDREMFTPSGNKRKWEQLYDDITLDSVVKAMQRRADKGGEGLFGSSIFGAAQEEFKSIDEIRHAARERIAVIDNDELQRQRQDIMDRLSAINIPGVGDSFSGTMDMVQNIQDAVARTHTAKGIHKYLKEFYPRVTMETANEIADIVKDIQKMTARYFEAKPYRAVGFNEVMLAVVPDNVNKAVLDELRGRNIPVEIYEHGNEEQRRQIVEDTSRAAGLLFRRVYHGSGADFDVFDLSHVGEGHGGQTHGYGVYVTEDNGAAKYFARASLPMGYTVNKIINDLSIEALKAGNGNKESALAYLQSRMTGYSERKMARAAMRVIESGRFLDEGVGRTFIYEVEIPDDTGENYLDWNGSADGVIDRRDISPEEYEANDLTTGGDIYRYLASKLGGNREASEYLSARGLVGIRYVSEEAERDNANNYVIFNDDDVQITDRTRFRFLGEKGAARQDIAEVNRRFNEQLEQQINGTLPEGHIYQLGMPSDILLSTGIPNLPVELSSTRLAEKAGQRNHEFTISDVAGLPEAMQNPIAVFSYGNKGKAQNIIVEIERDGKNFVVGLHLNQRRQGIEVNSIRGIFPKENAEWLNWVTQGKLLYADKEKIQTLIDKQQTNLADVEYLDLDSVANLLNSFENPKLPARNPVQAVTEAIREDSRIRQDNSQVRQPMQGTTESIRETCDSVAASLGVDVNYVTRDEMPRDSNGVQQRDAKGYQRGGRIYVCLENHSSEEDAAMTVMHEAVGHKGLRALVGPQNMDRFCMAVFRAATPEVRDEIFALSYKYDMHIGEAVEEYLAGLAEKGEFTQDERSFFRKVIDALMDLLERLGIHFNHPFSVADAKWLLWQSYHALEGNDVFIQARRAAIARRLGFSPVQNARKIDIDSLMRRSESDLSSINSAAESYANATTDVLNRLKETYVDQYTPLEILIKAVSDASGHPAEIWEDPMQSVYRISSVNQAEKTEFMTSFMQPMWTAVKKLSEKTDKGIDGIARYVMLKHGLERNDKFARRDAREHYRTEYAKAVSVARKKYTGAELDAALAEAEIALNGNLSAVDAGVDRVYLKNRETDYSGLMNMFSDYNWNGGSAERLPNESREQYNRRCREARRPKYESLAEAEAAAKSEIEGMEDQAATECTVLWEKIRAATGYILQHQYRAGMLSKESYDRISSMFEYYVPLRGFEDDTAEDLYQYYNRNASSNFTPPLAKAKGRKSVADNPFSQIGVLAESSIQQDNNNKAKLALYYFVSNRPDNGLVSASKAWYEFDGVDANGKKIWKEVYPDFSEVSEDGAPKAPAEILADFESRMRMMQESGAARQGRNKLDVSDRVVHVGNRSRQEHMIPVMVNGEKVNIIVQGNPRAAQAMNGLLNPDSRRDFLDRSIGIVTRFMANNFTSRNPEFWISNLQRDLLFSYMNVSIKEGGEYARRYRRNLSGGFRAVVYSMRHGSGNLGDSGLERMYREFVENGGVTGYTRLASAEEYENMMSKYLKNEERGKLARGIHTAFDKLRLFSEGIENVARFTAYLTSRESGKGIAASIMDAKNITVNFNRKGSVSPISWEESGNLMIRGRKLNWAERAIAVTLSSAAPYLKAGVAFFNAAIQALSVQVDIARRNPTKFAAWMSGYFALGMLNAMLHAMLDDDDDYLDMPDWERRNNILLGGNGVYLKWALPQESRPFYAMGDIIVNWSLGRMKHQNVFLEATKSFAEIAPPVMPTAAQPVIEIALNRDYMGSPIYRDMPWDESNPSYQRVYRNTNEILVSFSELLNTVSGGDYATPGAIGNNVFSNPAVWQHFIDGVGGGTAQFINKVGNIPFRMWDTFVDGEEWNWRTTPLANRIVISNDDRTRNSYLNEVYWYYKDISDSVVDRERKYKKEHDTERILDLRNSPEYDIMLVFKKYESVLEHYDGLLKEETDEYRRKEILRDKDDYVLRPMTDELLSADR